MTKKTKARHRRANRPMPALRTSQMAGLNDGLDDVRTGDAARSGARSSDVQRPDWTVPHIESTEASGDPFMTDLDVASPYDAPSQSYDAEGVTSIPAADPSATVAPVNEAPVPMTPIPVTPNSVTPISVMSIDERPTDAKVVQDKPIQQGNAQAAYQQPDRSDVSVPTGHRTNAAHANHVPGRSPYPAMVTFLRNQQLIGNQVLAHIEDNERAALRAMGALLQARSLLEILTIQMGFAADRFAAAGRQSAEMLALVGTLSASQPAVYAAVRK